MRWKIGVTQIPEFLEDESLTTDFAETQNRWITIVDGVIHIFVALLVFWPSLKRVYSISNEFLFDSDET